MILSWLPRFAGHVESKLKIGVDGRAAEELYGIYWALMRPSFHFFEVNISEVNISDG